MYFAQNRRTFLSFKDRKHETRDVTHHLKPFRINQSLNVLRGDSWNKLQKQEKILLEMTESRTASGGDEQESRIIL